MSSIEIESTDAYETGEQGEPVTAEPTPGTKNTDPAARTGEGDGAPAGGEGDGGEGGAAE